MNRWGLYLIFAWLLLSTAAHADELGTTTVALDGRQVGSQETNYGNFVTDALRDASGAQIAIVHAMAFRADAWIDKGVVDEQAIRRTIAAPGSTIVVLQLTPATLYAVMRRAMSRSPLQNSAFLQISGMQVVYDAAKPAALRVTSISIVGQKLDPADTKTSYKVAMPRELAAGAAGYVIDFTEDVLKTIKKTNITVFEAIAKEFEHIDGTITPTTEERLKSVKGESKP